MKNVLAVFVFALTILTVNAQEGPEPDIKLPAIFHAMEGEWLGDAQMTNPDGTMTEVRQHELVQFKLKESLLLIEGTGKDNEGKVMFNAFATMFYDNAKEELRMFAWTDEGRFTEADINVLSDNEMEWSFSPGGTAQIKYSLTIEEGKKWIEKGAFSQDGENWFPFFSMHLDKVE